MPPKLPAWPLHPMAPFGYCQFCQKPVRKFRGEGEAFWRCRDCGLILRSRPKRKPGPRKPKGLIVSGPLLHSR